MRIKEISLKNFKRFTDLTIKDIPESAKLVLLIGANGSGKSSVFDAFNRISKARYFKSEYYSKDLDKSASIDLVFQNGFNLNTYEGENDTWIYKPPFKQEFKKWFYGRSSIRIVPTIPLPDFTKSIANNDDSPASFILSDMRFKTDINEYISQVNNALRGPTFRGQSADTVKIFREFISPFNQSLKNIFGEQGKTSISLIEFEDAQQTSPAKFIFSKGGYKINYNLLSHGEKQVVILLLNFVIRNKYYQDTIYYIDEMDTHIETSIQKRLIKEIVEKWIPDGSQLWTASHALGFIEYANTSKNAVILDFDNLDFDVPQVIVPSRKDKMDVYEIAIPKEQIVSILKGYKLVAVENKDAVYLNAALGQDGYLFLPANNNREVFLTIKGDKNIMGLRDRDYLKPIEIETIQKQFPNLKILKLYTFENYIYHPNNLAELALAGFNKDEYIQEIIRQKQEKLISIASEIGLARSHYAEFKEDGINNDGKIEEITDALQSNDLETFYPYFNMKSNFNKAYLNQFQYTVSQLSRTNWFKTKMKELLA
jgi:AAA15 family ATPase/GTPase